MQPLIIALGRSDNHALLARHARAMGVEYFGCEAYEAAEMIREVPSLRSQLSFVSGFRPVLLAAIDSSIPSSLLRTFAQSLERETGVGISLRTEPKFLEPIKPQSGGLDRDFFYALSIARSPHGQISIWPVIRIDRDGGAQPIIDEDLLAQDGVGIVDTLHSVTTEMINHLSQERFVGLMTYVVDPIASEVVRKEFGAASITFWSESASYTSASEQMVRAILDLPLGDARMIDFEEFFMREEFEIPAGVISDPIRPFLHLFARNPRLKVNYLGDPGSEQSRGHSSGEAMDKASQNREHRDRKRQWRRCVISLFASSEDEGLREMAHARDFISGIDEVNEIENSEIEISEIDE